MEWGEAVLWRGLGPDVGVEESGGQGVEVGGLVSDYECELWGVGLV